MQTIATSARSSLRDVRQVLTLGHTGAVRRGGLDSLIETLQGNGHRIVSTEVGEPRPLPPELELVAYRVLQEMLTNAIKHGRRDEPVVVQRHWPDRDDEFLRITVQNHFDAAAGTGESGQGLDGMRRRLESVGGRFEARGRAGVTGRTFTATAQVPVRPPSARSGA
jgi:signal transduction histidine kinase